MRTSSFISIVETESLVSLYLGDKMNYFFSLAKRIFSRRNLGFVFYLFFNAVPIYWIVAQVSSPVFFLPVFAAYFFISIEAGTAFAKLMLNARTQMRLEDGGSLIAAFSQAYAAAKEVDSRISDNVRLYVYNSVNVEAYALGRRVICLSSTAIGLPEGDLTALLLLKFAQFAHYDSEMLTFMTAGNLWYMILSVIFKGYIYLVGIVFWAVMKSLKYEFEDSVIFNLLKVLAWYTEKGLHLLMRVFLRLGLSSYGDNIFENDKFVCDCGYRNDLVHFLRNYESERPGQETLLDLVNSMKPNKQTRLAKLACYRQTPSGGFRIIRRE